MSVSTIYIIFPIGGFVFKKIGFLICFLLTFVFSDFRKLNIVAYQESRQENVVCETTKIAWMTGCRIAGSCAAAHNFCLELRCPGGAH